MVMNTAARRPVSDRDWQQIQAYLSVGEDRRLQFLYREHRVEVSQQWSGSPRRVILGIKIDGRMKGSWILSRNDPSCPRILEYVCRPIVVGDGDYTLVGYAPFYETASDLVRRFKWLGEIYLESPDA